MKLKMALISMLLVLGAVPLGFASTDSVAIVVSSPADGIVAAPYAKAMGYKLIITPKNELSKEAESQLKDVNKVIIVGGPVAVSKNVENSIRALNKNTERVAGETRIETSMEMYKLIKKENPKMLKNIVIADGFDEKVTPVAVSFGAPVLYYGLNKDDEIAELLKNTNPENAVVIGTKIPKTITNTITNQAKNTIIASGNEENAVKTALAYVTKLNPKSENKGAFVVYAGESNSPILNAVMNFVNGDFGTIAPIPNMNENTINKIISKITFVSEILILSDNDNVANKISKIAVDLGINAAIFEDVGSNGVRVGSSSWGVRRGSSGGSSYTPTTDEKPAIKIIANDKTVEFKGQDSNTLSIVGSKTINFPTLVANVNVVNKKDVSKNISMYFKDNNSVKSIIESLNNYKSIAYNGDNITITYNNPDMNGKNVTLSVISDRSSIRDAINTMLNGNASDLIGLIKMNQYSMYNCTKTIANNKATWTIPASNFNGEVAVIVTEGNLIPSNATDVNILATGGFLAPKYNVTLTFIGTNTLTNETTYNISLNTTPTNNVRYGLAMINRNTNIFMNVEGTNPNNNLFNVSVQGNSGSELIVENNNFIKLNASKITNIINTIFTPNIASSTYGSITTNNKTQLSTQNITDSYVIGIVYDTVDKKIVAIEQQ